LAHHDTTVTTRYNACTRIAKCPSPIIVNSSVNLTFDLGYIHSEPHQYAFLR